jgi:hypothetical protein
LLAFLLVKAGDINIMFLETIEVEKPTTRSSSDCLSALALVGVLGFDRHTRKFKLCMSTDIPEFLDQDLYRLFQVHF